MMGEGIRISLHTGDVYVGRIGHPDHARMDILGPTVNIASSLGPYNRRVASNVIVTSTVVDGAVGEAAGGAGVEFHFGPGEEATFRFTDARVTVHELQMPPQTHHQSTHSG